jgi:hypothetical protein
VKAPPFVIAAALLTTTCDTRRCFRRQGIADIFSGPDVGVLKITAGGLNGIFGSGAHPTLWIPTSSAACLLFF